MSVEAVDPSKVYILDDWEYTNVERELVETAGRTLGHYSIHSGEIKFERCLESFGRKLEGNENFIGYKLRRKKILA